VKSRSTSRANAPAGIGVAVLVILVFGCAAAMASPARSEAAPAGEVTRASGSIHATLLYRKLQDLGANDDYFAGGRVRISRGGKTILDERVPLDPRLAAGTPVQGDTASFVVRDVDGDREPEVMLELDSGGAHYCAWARLYRYAGARDGYVPVVHFWGNTSSSPTIVDVDGDGRPEFVSTDDRFAYDFNGYAGSVRPIQIWSYAHGRFRDVTRDHPQLVRRDALRLWRLYLKDRRELPGSARGILPAWAAEQYLLGHGAQAERELRNAGPRGYLAPAVDGPREPDAYVAAVERLLRRTGYIPR
jgi:hypothetical protein